MNDIKYSFIFIGLDRNPIAIAVKGETKISQLIRKYFEKIKRLNLLVNNIDNLYFIYNAKKINSVDYEKTVSEFFHSLANNYIEVINGYNARFKFEIIEVIKENLYTTVYKAKAFDNNYPKYVAVKKNKKR